MQGIPIMPKIINVPMICLPFYSSKLNKTMKCVKLRFNPKNGMGASKHFRHAASAFY